MSDQHKLFGFSNKPIGRRTLLGAVSAAALVTVGCAQHPPGSTPDPTPRESPAGPTTPEPKPEPEPDDGSIPLAIVVSVSKGSPIQIEYDPVTLYYGDEAVERAKADGSDVVEVDEDGNEYIPNDYYIPEADPSKRKKLPLSPDAEIEAISPDIGAPPNEPITVDELRVLVTERPAIMTMTMDEDESQITGLSEYYLP